MLKFVQIYYFSYPNFHVICKFNIDLFVRKASSYALQHHIIQFSQDFVNFSLNNYTGLSLVLCLESKACLYSLLPFMAD